MLGLLKAAVLLAPALELAWAATPATVSNDEDLTSGSLITLALEGISNYTALQQTTLDLRVFESTTPCGYGNVSLNGESLAQDDSGFGSGSIPTESGSVLTADWKFTCVHLDQDSEVQLLSVRIVSVDDQDIDDVAFSVQFQQIAPVSVSYIDGANAKLKSLPAPNSSNNRRPSLEDELADLEVLKEQLLALEHSIALKIAHISDSFNLDQPEKLLGADCGGLKCFFGTIFDRMKTAAKKLYHSGKGDGFLASRPGNPHWPSSQGDQRPLMKISSVSSSQESGSFNSQNAADDQISTANKDTSDPSHDRRPLTSESWLRDGLRREGVEDQEKDAMMRQLRESDLEEESSDALSTTMEEEIAQFRAAASAVGNLVSVDESLPAYDENRSPEYDVDGFQLTPAGSTSGSSSSRSSSLGGSTTRSSLDENVERKE
ncbi:hypothetical protein FHL15_002454 [Xylaria flabelliformis]|uniref:Uncharacterized protein n=1 Tax=Xylaria flabelliformis TaxID=2512241 RepID=A0A553I8P6_9PEZI|nr:hypothetical protein FHL15_002454 [Xylaria flabelliformis]